MGEFYRSIDGASFNSSLKVDGPDMPFPMKQTSEIIIAKPDKFLAKSTDAMMGGVDAASNGTQMSVALPMFKIYQETTPPSSFDKFVPEDEQEMMAMDSAMLPLAQDPGLLTSLTLFGSNPTQQMLNDVDSITMVGKDRIEGIDAVRIRIVSKSDMPSSPAENADIWIAQGDEPWLLAVKPDLEAMMAGDPMGAGDMEITLLFEKWKRGAPADTRFTLQVDEDWEKVDDLMAAVMEKAAEQMGQDFDFEGDAPAAFEQPEHASVGNAAPAFDLKTLRTGEQVTLDSLKGKVVVLDFWATWCSPCVAGLPTVDKVTTSFKDKGVVFYAIDLREPADRVKQFVDKKKWTFPVLLDDNGSVAKDYGVNGIPHSVVIGADGRIRNVHVGFGGAKALEEQLTKELEEALAEVSTQG